MAWCFLLVVLDDKTYAYFIQEDEKTAKDAYHYQIQPHSFLFCVQIVTEFLASKV